MRHAVLASIALCACMMATPAVAAVQCGATEWILQQLGKRYGERVIGRASYQPDGAWRMLLASRSVVPPPSWSIVEVHPGNFACVMVTGRGLPSWILDRVSGRDEV